MTRQPSFGQLSANLSLSRQPSSSAVNNNAQPMNNNTQAAPAPRPQPTVGQVMDTLKQFVPAQCHPQLEALQQQYLSRQIDKRQLELGLRKVAGDAPLRQAVARLASTAPGKPRPAAAANPAAVAPAPAVKSELGPMDAMMPSSSDSNPVDPGSREAKALVLHAYTCRDNQCIHGQKCFETKLKLSQLVRHASQCTKSQSGTGAASQCRLCRMWKYVQQMGAAIQQLPQNGTSIAELHGGSNATQAEESKPKIKVREPNLEMLRKVAIDHISKCNGCDKCQRLRQKMQMKKAGMMPGGSRPGEPPAAKKARTNRQRPGGKNSDFMEGERVEVFSGNDAQSTKQWRSAKVLEVRDEEDGRKLLLQHSGTIGNAYAIAGYEVVPASENIRKASKTRKDGTAPAVDEGHFGEGFCVEVRTRSGSHPQWSTGRVAHQVSNQFYTVKLETGVLFQGRREEVRAVCSGCRKRALIFELPQLYCIKCKIALRLPGNIYYCESDEAATAAGGGKGVHLCLGCMDELRNNRSQAGKDPLYKQIGRTEELDIDAFSEIKVPKSGQPEKHGRGKDECAPFVQCTTCTKWYHWVCGLYNEEAMRGLDWSCAECRHAKFLPLTHVLPEHTAEVLARTDLGDFVEEFVRQALESDGIQCAPVTVRLVSSMKTASPANDALIRHFRQRSGQNYPKEFPYCSNALMAFQRIQGQDVLLFALYVQEYGQDCPEPNQNRVYVSYLDSVRYFESTPTNSRTTLYHALLVGYLEHARQRGFRKVHIWVEPPKLGDEYIFFARPVEERRPMGREKLHQWYQRMVNKAIKAGIVEHSNGLMDEFRGIHSICEIPCFHGDLWETTLPAILQGHENGIISEHDLLQQTFEEMDKFEDHFMVATLKAPPPGAFTVAQEQVPISNAITNFREAFVGKSQVNHWQFTSLQFAKYSTMMMLHCLHTSPKPTYCILTCKRGRAEDDTFMICCDECEQWFHGDCVGVSKAQADAMGRYCCSVCETQTMGQMFLG